MSSCVVSTPVSMTKTQPARVVHRVPRRLGVGLVGVQVPLVRRVVGIVGDHGRLDRPVGLGDLDAGERLEPRDHALEVGALLPEVDVQPAVDPDPLGRRGRRASARRKVEHRLHAARAERRERRVELGDPGASVRDLHAQ
jgi:hypothetical protein